MALRTAYRQASKGIVIPYRETEGGNHGFIDLRGRPDLAPSIIEASASTALCRLLVRLAEPNASIVSLGCDLGEHCADGAPQARRQVAGGYVHVVAADFEKPDAQAFHALATALETAAAAQVGHRSWELVFVLQEVELHLDGDGPRRCSSLSILFYAAAPNRAAAAHSREALIEVLHVALASPIVRATLCGGAADGRND